MSKNDERPYPRHDIVVSLIETPHERMSAVKATSTIPIDDYGQYDPLELGTAIEKIMQPENWWKRPLFGFPGDPANEAD